MIMEVRPMAALSSASCTTRSDSESNVLVASSSRRILGALIMALAIAILCFCPPDNCTPLSPHSVSYPFFSDLHKNKQKINVSPAVLKFG